MNLVLRWNNKVNRSCQVVLFWLMSVLLLPAPSAYAGKPEYMKIAPKVGLSLEIKGSWDSSGVFEAKDIEILPKPRKPKLRGEIQSVNTGRHTITVYGIEIEVNEKTVFESNGNSDSSYLKLRKKQRIEVTCKVDSKGNWRARKIQTQDIKKSNKIKGTVTKIHVDGIAPDTLEIDGLLILLNRKTDVDDPLSDIEESEKYLLGDLSRNSVSNINDGYLVSENFLVGASYRHQFRNENEFNLSDADFDEFNTQPDLRLKAIGFMNNSIRGAAHLRLRKRYMLSGNQNQSSGSLDAEFTQLFVVLKDFGVRGLAFQIGRQDFDENREWLFDEYLDAVRVYYYGINRWKFEAAFIQAVNPINVKFDTWTDYLGRAIWTPSNLNEFSAYFLLRSDTDLRNREPKWYGVRYYGQPRSGIRSWADYSIMGGEDKGDNLQAWALDFGATATAQNTSMRPSLTVGYAIGSGDRPGDADDQQFRQTAYQDNVDRFGGLASVRYYGAVLAPELSNLKIITLGAGIRPTALSSIELIYHSYRQHFADPDVKGSDLVDPPARPNGFDSDIGWGVDVVTALREVADRIQLTWTLGLFSPGQAYSSRQKTAVLNKLNMTVNF